MSLPKSKDKFGYSKEEIELICKERNIKLNKFWIAFGVNTVSVAKDGTSRYYQCDVERALYLLKNKDGQYHLWD